MKKITLWMMYLGSAACLLSGCAKKELERMTDSTEEKKEELLMEYKFTQNGISTVDIGESREMILAFRHFNNAINSKTQSNFSKQLENYRKSIAGTLSPTNESLRKPVADHISGLADQLYALVNSEAVSRKAQPGVSGTVAVSNEESRMLDEKGVELGQVIQKALMGALTLDKVDYFLEKSLKADNALPVAGKNYTEMAHCWDTAYGYLGTLDVDPNRLAPLFLANYIEKEAVGMQGLSGINTSVYQAFYKGRKAIGDHNLEEVRKQVAFLRGQMAQLFSLRTVYYLRESQTFLERTVSVPSEGYFHSMGEALGFILALPFVKDEAGKSRITWEQAVALYDGLTQGETGVWEKDRLTGVQEGSISAAIEKVHQYFH